MPTYDELCDRAEATGGPRPIRWHDGSYWHYGPVFPAEATVRIGQAEIIQVIEGECPRCHVPLERRRDGGYCQSCGWTWMAEFSGSHGTVTAAWIE